jgi:hypothetical protein
VPRRPTPWRRLTTATRWPVGIGLTSWSYMWRTTPLHRSEEPGTRDDDAPPPLPAELSDEELQGPESGVGPLFHRRYRGRVRDSQLSADALMAQLHEDPDRAAPTTMASFQKVLGDEGRMAVNDEYVVRMPGPWDGPVRVAEVTPRSFRLVTLETHLEAGTIEFRADEEEDGRLRFEIESWARSGDRLSNFLYHHLRMAKEIQLHMWSSYIERVARRCDGRLDRGLEIHTRRVEWPDGA